MAEALSVTSTQVAAGDCVIAVAYNFHGTRLACATAKHTIKIYNIDDEETMDFSAEMQAKGPPGRQGKGETKLAWAHHQLGQVVAVTFSGLPVSLWVETSGHDKEWIPIPSPLPPTHAVVRDISFSPKEYGNQLAVAYSDGIVQLFEAAASLPPTAWAMCNHFKATNGQGGCTCVSWRGATVSEPGPLMAVGTSGHGASVWQYENSLMSWQECTRFGEGHVACLAWAPTLGRPSEIVAVGTGSSVQIWALSGTADADMAVEKVDTVSAGAPVWKVEWNMLGTSLAVSTDSAEVLVFSPNLVGKFTLSGRFVGNNGTDSGRVVPME
mmetsp:Transcript_32993/g.93431  ORF Transcript_32993/g.93431 Transcript_32993/m.93431 type:complete len:325 (+) Transcript_32993:163-1137(+)|eukprot:CAMPEP_0117675292 /NCGR_PEP_ID=MMETSP0804-20121206/15524_1 /TAXON_ID=1074897 /ORGANISM="Tetraselmis astigmatica, Strain CCMP880" /LENGTH=324 /DNA_ID=CAMNT_0005484279 /DNA_START=72 /DNA_END=1046 /DNA_ORIENTATION=+